MGENINLELEGVEELQEKLMQVYKRGPDRIYDRLDKDARKFMRQARKNTPVGPTGNLKKGYRKEQAVKHGDNFEVGIYNRAPHHHLVNNGHRKVSPSGKVLGWTDGLFYIEKTVSEEAEPMAREQRKWLKELYQELF